MTGNQYVCWTELSQSLQVDLKRITNWCNRLYYLISLNAEKCHQLEYIWDAKNATECWKVNGHTLWSTSRDHLLHSRKRHIQGHMKWEEHVQKVASKEIYIIRTQSPNLKFAAAVWSHRQNWTDEEARKGPAQSDQDSNQEPVI